MYQVTVNNKNIYKTGKERGGLMLEDQPVLLDISEIKKGQFSIIRGNKHFNAEIIDTDPSGKSFTIKVNNRVYEAVVADKYDLLLKKLGMDTLHTVKLNEIKAPMPGLVLEIMVQKGQEIPQGEPVMILEAMKMENVLKSPGEGKVKMIHVNKGDAVEKNQVLISFE